MARKHGNRKHRVPHRTATRRPRGAASTPEVRTDPFQDPLMVSLREALRDRDPIAFWGAATPVVALVDEPGALEEALPEGVDLLQTFVDVDVAETTALLHMVAAMSGDELKRARARRAVRGRRQPVPPHVSGLAELAVTGTRVFSDYAGDNHLLELALPGEVRVTLVTYVERSPRLYLKDAFFIAERLEAVQERFKMLMVRDGVTEGGVRDLDPAQSRAALERALQGADAGPVKEPEEGDQWPMCRPLVEFALARLPEGGSGYDESGFLVGQEEDDLLVPDSHRDDEYAWLDDGPMLDDERSPGDETFELAEEFVASPQARDLPTDVSTQVLAGVLLSMAEVAEGDALHWCANTVRWVVEEALPRSPLLPDEAVEQVGQVLPALVRWAHEVSEEDAETVQEALAIMPGLLEDLPRRWTSKEMEVGRLDTATEFVLLTGDPVDIGLALLVQRVGGATTLQGLGTDPLPAEPLVLDDVPPDLHARLTEVDAALVAGLAEVRTDQPPRPASGPDEELLTACRRFLVQATTHDPDVLRGRAGVVSTAAAVVWVVGRGNGLVGRSAPVRTSELTRAFGVRSTPSERAERLQEAAVLPHAPEGEPPALGSPDLLVSSARRTIRDEYERLTAAAAED